MTDTASLLAPLPTPIPIGPASDAAFGLYVHIPFCETKCSYCSFNSIPSDGGLHEAFVDAVCREIRSTPIVSPPVDTVFFGGGTPSLLSPAQLARILTSCRETFRLRSTVARQGSTVHRQPSTWDLGPWTLDPGPGTGAPEISIECNPGTVDAAALAALRAAGFNRASFGAQSFDDAELASLGRIHAAADIGRALRDARAAGFDDVSLDLIFALPGQTMDRWIANLRAALDLGPDHLSCYMLQFDPGTPLTAAMLRGEVKPLDESLQTDMLLATIDLLTNAGLPPYEISNYAKPGFECRHNLKYWTGAPYLGYGPGAHSFLPAVLGSGFGVQGSAHRPRQRNPKPETPNPEPSWGTRFAAIAGIEDYIRRVQAGEPAVAMREELTREQRMFETVFLGLRRTAGVDLGAFERTFGTPFDAPYGRTADRLIGQGLLARADGRLRLTRKGLPVADAVMAEFTILMRSGPPSTPLGTHG
jgi:oxygen-independent coproporphyrinogen-3 oxidase